MCYRLSVRMEQLYSHCTNDHEILYYRRVTKSVHQIKVRLNKPTGADTLHADRSALIFISRHLRDSYRTKNTAQTDRPKTQLKTYIERSYLENRKEKRVNIKRKF